MYTPIYIQAFPSGPLHTNAYLVACQETRQAAVIDPAQYSTEPIRSALDKNNFICTKILLTHSHWDHIADVKELREWTHAPVYVHPEDVPNLENPGADRLPCPIKIVGLKPDHLLEEGQQITVGNLMFKVIHTPGHSIGSVCFYNEAHKILLSGDTLFKGTMGKISFPTSAPKLMKSSLNKLGQLPPDTQVFPGHGDTTTIGAESWISLEKK